MPNRDVFNDALYYHDFTSNSLPSEASIVRSTTGIGETVPKKYPNIAANTPIYAGSRGLRIPPNSTVNIGGDISAHTVVGTMGAGTGIDAGKTRPDGVTTGALKVVTGSSGFTRRLSTYVQIPMGIDFDSNGPNWPVTAWAFRVWPVTQTSGIEYWISLYTDITAPSSGAAATNLLKLDASLLTPNEWNYITPLHPAIITDTMLNRQEDTTSGTEYGHIAFSANEYDVSYYVDHISFNTASIDNSQYWQSSALRSAPSASTGTPGIAAVSGYLNLPISGIPSNDICGYWSGYIAKEVLAIGGPGNPRVFSLSKSTTVTETVEALGFHPGGQIQLNIGNGVSSASMQLNFTGQKPVENETDDWTYVEFTWRKDAATGLTVWASGKLQGNLDSAEAKANFANPANMTNIYIGRGRKNQTNTSEFICESFAIWDYAKSDSELKALSSLNEGSGSSSGPLDLISSKIVS